MIVFQQKMVVVLCIAVAGCILPYVSVAQTTGSSPDFISVIQQLQEQINLLISQVNALKAELGLQSDETLTAGIAAPPILSRTLGRGDRGDDVRALQRFLTKQGANIYPEGLVTGYYGPLTEAAIERWQAENGIEVVGVVGPKTIEKFKTLGGGTIEHGVGLSGNVPPGLLIAPSLEDKLINGTSTPPVATSTPPASTSTPSVSLPPPPVPSGSSSATSPPSASAPPPPPVTPPPPPGGNGTSTPAALPPVISNVQVSNITNTSATFTWTTDIYSSTELYYKTAEQYALNSVIDTQSTGFVADPGIDHTANFSSFSPGTGYYYRVASRINGGGVNDIGWSAIGLVTTTSPTPVTGACLIRASSGYVPPNFYAPDLGAGYAKLAKPGINSFDGLKAACTQLDYESLLANYCTSNTESAQQQVVVYYDQTGGPLVFGCGSFGCDLHTCSSAGSSPKIGPAIAAVLQTLSHIVSTLLKLVQ